jgi:hypothetical protein
MALLQQSAVEQEKEFGDLLACLGQESAKVAALQQLLGEAGVDAAPVLAQVEADYGFGDEEEDAEEEAVGQSEGGEADEGAQAPAQGSLQVGAAVAHRASTQQTGSMLAHQPGGKVIPQSISAHASACRLYRAAQSMKQRSTCRFAVYPLRVPLPAGH